MSAVISWALAWLLSLTCGTPTAWIDVATIQAECGDEDGNPITPWWETLTAGSKP